MNDSLHSTMVTESMCVALGYLQNCRSFDYARAYSEVFGGTSLDQFREAPGWIEGKYLALELWREQAERTNGSRL